MNIPKGMTSKKDLKEILEKLLEDDKVNIILLKEEKNWIALKCYYSGEGIILAFDDQGNAKRLLGCDTYDEDTGQCGGGGHSCRYLNWKELKPYEKDGNT